jgi:predicted acylesterase/phospholipase RssA
MKRRHLLLAGGGFKILTFCGALQLLDLSAFDVIGGVSAGALLAAVLALGYAPETLPRRLVDLGLARQLVASSSLRDAVAGRGLMDPLRLCDLLVEHFLRPRGLDERSTLRDLRVATGVDLRVPCARVHPPGLVVFSSRATPDVPLVRALAASMAIPGVFAPVEVMPGLRCVDGALVNNLPVSCVDPERAVVLALPLDEELATASLSDRLQCAVTMRINLLPRAGVLTHQRSAFVVYVPRTGGLLTPPEDDEIDAILAVGRLALAVRLLQAPLAALLLQALRLLFLRPERSLQTGWTSSAICADSSSSPDPRRPG